MEIKSRYTKENASDAPDMSENSTSGSNMIILNLKKSTVTVCVRGATNLFWEPSYHFM